MMLAFSEFPRVLFTLINLRTGEVRRVSFELLGGIEAQPFPLVPNPAHRARLIMTAGSPALSRE